ncbi:DUF418 domain-containing protein [Pseudoalteromonas ardens]|uniref:Membrane protein n=1 Tax=Pseudoalteromonas rubra TaxID=43658 RepID=A0A0L0EXB9_9GAMM|nr:DUF418 domain-containing protein [Pseudoalteromonas sp. R96]KNC69086.1 membrane protein [Pseudoalteromonas rubra]MDK1310491.1 DUF418 domain-containing protein [Pseudoalteromonas sp. R96]
MSARIHGIDLARALAIFGMVVVNFKLVMGATTGSPLLLSLSGLLEGRAAALFVVLAGAGLTLTARKMQNHGLLHQKQLQNKIVMRGILLLCLGLLYLPVWPADILHFYGCYFILASWLLFASHRTLLTLCAVVVSTFPALLLIIDYSKGWHWETLTYLDLWTLDGLVRRIFYNGFHPVFPWFAFLLFGMWLGRQPLHNIATQRKLFVRALVTLIAVEAAFYLLRSFAVESGMQDQDIRFLLSTGPIPPLPQYLVCATATAVLILISCIKLSQRFAHTAILKTLENTGKLSLTFYITHIIIGMGILESLNMLGDQSIELALLSSLIFCLSAWCFAILWSRKFTQGPMEWLFRYLINRAEAYSGHFIHARK